MKTIDNLLADHSKILIECAIAERLRRQPGVMMDPTLFNAPLIYGSEKEKQPMEAIYREYLEIAREAGLPILLMAPTWRLDQDRVAEAGVPTTINSDAVAFLTGIRDDFPPSAKAPALVGALTGPQNDCYRPDLAPDMDAAETFHQPQINELASTGIDFLSAQTLPAVGEAIGIGRAMAATDKPYILSFCTGAKGHVLDGTPLPEAFDRVDAATASRPPTGYFVNCTHPQFLLEAYPPTTLDRLIGIQANGSSKDVTQLDGSGETEADDLEKWASAMLSLHRTHKVPGLGGCCGTTGAHLKSLAKG
ncbi:MAG: homocysteine S-methyltransferase family protein [Verrucomicrobiota bacterium]